MNSNQITSSRFGWLRASLAGCVLVVMTPFLLADSEQSAPSYPREFNDTAGKVQISQPVISDWAELRKLAGTIPLQIDSAQGETWKGTVAFEVATRIHLDERQVSLNSMRLESWNFDRGALPSQLRGLATRALEEVLPGMPRQPPGLASPGDNPPGFQQSPAEE